MLLFMSNFWGAHQFQPVASGLFEKSAWQDRLTMVPLRQFGGKICLFLIVQHGLSSKYFLKYD